MHVNLNRVGLEYGIAREVGILVLVSTIMLASYVCVRVHQTTTNHTSSSTSGASVLDSGSGASFADWSSGLDQITVESYPKVVYSASQPLPDNPPCSTSMGDCKEDDLLRLLAAGVQAYVCSLHRASMRGCACTRPAPCAAPHPSVHSHLHAPVGAHPPRTAPDPPHPQLCS